MPRRPRGPGFVYSGVATLLAVAILAFSLSAQQPPPPAIAEFAPQAVDQITDAPDEQSSRFGAGEGDCAPGATGCELELGEQPPGAMAVRSTPEPIDVPRVRQCVGDPPRQIEDPQSPPCVPYWSGDNGGETHPGVARNEVRIALPYHDDTKEENLPREWEALESFFNKRFELYGRKIRLMPFNAGYDYADSLRPEVQTSHAQETVARQIDAFASMPYPDTGGSTIYYDQLARQKRVSAHSLVPRVGEEHFGRRHPHQWSYVPSMDLSGPNLAEFTCKQLKGKKARWAGSDQADKDRSFALVVVEYQEGFTDIGDTQQLLRSGCGIDTEIYTMRYKGDDGQASQNLVLDLKAEGYTTILCFCHIWPLCMGVFYAANQHQYHPEWVFASFPFIDHGTNTKACLRDQMSHMFGISAFSKWQSSDDSPVTWAIKEVDPSFSWPVEGQAQEWMLRRYTSLLMLASGIQLAGPNLTPETFASGLQRARFPNPETRYMAARAGFRGDHSMNDDYAPVWWGADRNSVWGAGPGAWCYVDGGKRYSLGGWPTQQLALFEGPCY